MAVYECGVAGCREEGRHEWTRKVVTGGSSSHGSRGLASGKSISSYSKSTDYRVDHSYLCNLHYEQRLAEIAARRAANRRRNFLIVTLLAAVLAVGYALFSFNKHEVTQSASTPIAAPVAGPASSTPAVAPPELPNVSAPTPAAPSAAPSPADKRDASSNSSQEEELSESEAIDRALETGRATDYGTEASGGTIRVRDEPSQDGQACRSYMALEDNLPTSWSTVCRNAAGHWRSID